MQLVFIIFGIVIIVSFITGIILTVRENKNKSVESLTDDPRILFSVDEDKAIIAKSMQSNEMIASSEGHDENLSNNLIVEEVVSDSEGFDLPTNHDYNSQKFIVHPTIQVTDDEKSEDVPVVIATTPNTIENKNSEARFVSYNFDSEEEII